MLAELTSSSLIASATARIHAPRPTKNDTIPTMVPTPPPSTKPRTNRNTANPNHGTELVFSFLSDITRGQSLTQWWVVPPGSPAQTSSRAIQRAVTKGKWLRATTAAPKSIVRHLAGAR